MMGWFVAAIALAACIYLAFALRRARLVRAAAAVAADARHLALERERVAADERERIFRDLHDDVGAKLLDLALTVESPAHADLARSVLQDLRDVVSRSRGEPGHLHDVLWDIGRESAQRLESLGIGIDWQLDDALPDPRLDHGAALHLHRIVREALTNAVKHASPQHIRIRVLNIGPDLVLDVTDVGGEAVDGVVTPGGGRGTDSMRARAEALHGSIRWAPGTLGGTKVILKMPLPTQTD